MGNCLANLVGASDCFSFSVLEFLTDGIVIWNRNFEYLLINKSARDLFNYCEEANINSPTSNDFSLYPVPGDKWIDRCNQVISSGLKSEFKDTFQLAKQNVYTESVLFPVFNGTRNLVAIMVIIKNVTEKNIVLEELTLNNKFAELGKTVAFITHELKTPLNSIMMTVDLLREDSDLMLKERESLDIIKRELKRLNKLIKGILNTARPEDLFASHVNLATVIESAINIVNPILKEKAILIKNDVKNSIILGIEPELESVFLELLSNSIYTISKEDIIEIYSEEFLREKIVKVIIKNKGFEIKQPEKIFLPFFTNHQGNDIDLQHIQKILEKFNASISVGRLESGFNIFELTFKMAE